MKTLKKLADALLSGKHKTLRVVVFALLFLAICAGMSLQALDEAKRKAGLK